MTAERRNILQFLVTAAMGTVAWAAPQEKAMFGMIGKMSVAPGKRADVIALLAQAVVGMPGCLSYVIAEDASDENGIWITEVWDSRESHDASLALPEVRKAITTARPMITGFSNQVTTTPVGGFGISRSNLAR